MTLKFDQVSEFSEGFNVFQFSYSEKVLQSATLATSPKPESSRNYVGLVKAPASLARQSEPPSHNMHCPFATSISLEKRCGGGGGSEKFHLLALQSSTEKSIWHRLVLNTKVLKVHK